MDQPARCPFHKFVASGAVKVGGSRADEPRIDADVIAWFKTHTPNGAVYQTNINRALREYVEQHTGVPPDRL
jgi:uncharacterized protein (DUF4415 family)